MTRDPERRRASNRARSARWRARHLERARAQDRANSAANRAVMRKLKERPCADCGGTFDPVCMDFDHRPGETKLFGVGKATTLSPRVLAEIAKCDLVCANCHRLRTKNRNELSTKQRAWRHGRSLDDTAPQLAIPEVLS